MAGAVRRISRAKRLQIDPRLTELFTYCAVHLAYLAYLWIEKYGVSAARKPVIPRA